ncbi:hypothetical protein Tco_0800354 [Tanacetum coccineum]|uniref:Uncharacterized protein n=1 Tax=Tanacetum coccineum TaxID=301880 RepID=A0ABQ4ZV92_9ASTR
MDEEFTATAYPNVQENLKLTVDDPMIPEEPASSTRTLSSLQHLAKDFSFEVFGKEILARLYKDGDADASFHFRNYDKYYHDPEECEYAGLKVTTSHEGNIPQQG